MNLKYKFWGLLTFLIIFLVTGCDGIGVTRSVPPEQQPPLFIAPTYQATTGVLDNNGSNEGGNPTPTATCTDQLQWMYDLSIPDGSQVNPGSVLEKQWQVKNTGTCNWDNNYTLRLTAGIDMGAASPQMLVPARGGSEAVIQIQFTAPVEQGRYRSAWQAYNPSGQPFGDPIFIEIVVTSP